MQLNKYFQNFDKLRIVKKCRNAIYWIFSRLSRPSTRDNAEMLLNEDFKDFDTSKLLNCRKFF